MSEQRTRVLIVYGSERGGTAEIANAIGATLLAEHFDVDIANARETKRIDDYHAVIIGGALYMGRWQRDARRFVKRHAAALRERTVYMFSSGPLDRSAGAHEVPPPPSVAALVRAAGARSHAMFGGRLARDAKGFVASRMAKTLAGDWRSWDDIRAWTRELARSLREMPAPSSSRRGEPATARWLLAALCFFVGVTAVIGGAMLIARPSGRLFGMTPALLARTPFASFLVPGLILVSVVGLGNIVAGVLATRDRRIANHVAFAAGTALLVWITVQMAMLHTMRWLQLGYIIIAASIMLEAYRRWSRLTSSARKGPPLLAH